MRQLIIAYSVRVGNKGVAEVNFLCIPLHGNEVTEFPLCDNALIKKFMSFTLSLVNFEVKLSASTVVNGLVKKLII